LGIFLFTVSEVLADITTTGVVSPASVTTGTVTGEAVFIGDPDFTGGLTVDGGSSLLVDNVNGGSGISMSFNAGNLVVSGAGTTVEVNARTTLRLDNGATALIDGGSYVLLNGSDTRLCGGGPCAFNRGRAIDVFGNGVVTVDGAGTQVDLIRRLRLRGGTMNVTNGARVDMDGTDSSLITSFVIGQAGSSGELALDGGGTLVSLVPLAFLGVGATAVVDVLDSSVLELTTSAVIGGGNGQATVNITNSSFSVLADPAAPNPETGNINLGSSGMGVINVIGGLLDVENDMFISRDASAGASGRLVMSDSSSAVIGGNLYISHDGVVSAGLGTGFVLTCNSTLDATETFIGENGQLAGTTVNGNITIEGGRLSPGCSPGVMTVNGNVEFIGGQLVIEVDGATAVDKLNVVGEATFGGGEIVLSFGNGYAPPPGTSLELADYLETEATSGLETVEFEVEGLQGPDGTDFEFDVTADGTVTTTTEAVPEFVAALIAIRPNGPNFVDPASDQVFPVAILTTEDEPIFDATEVDPDTISFGPAGATPVSKKTRLKDVDHDGDLDLRVWFRIQETGISCGDVSATMSGQTYAGTDFEASDELITLDCE
jgi:hypothetical protein